MKKMIIGAMTALPAVAAFAEGESSTPQVITDLQTSFTSYISAGATAVVALLTAGVAIVGALWAFRLLKRAFNGSK